MARPTDDWTFSAFIFFAVVMLFIMINLGRIAYFLSIIARK